MRTAMIEKLESSVEMGVYAAVKLELAAEPQVQELVGVVDVKLVEMVAVMNLVEFSKSAQ